MTKYFRVIIFILLLTACAPDGSETISGDVFGDSLPTPTSGTNEMTDVVYTNGEIYTVNPNQPWAEAVAIRDGVILAVGSEQEVLAEAGPNPRIVDLDGSMMLPGFQDPHLHVLEAGLNESLCFVSDFAEFDDYIFEIRDCAAKQMDSEWVRAAGANMADLLYRERLPIEVLDEAIPDRPVIIIDDLGHGAWLNSLAMQAVGYDVLDGNPPGGILVRDPETGQLTGLVLENAQQKVRSASLPPTPENLALAYEGLLLGLEIVAQNGITTVSDAGGYWTRGHHRAWQRAVEEGTLTARANNALYLYPDRDFDEQLETLQQLHSDDPDQLLRFGQVKIYIDGILSQGTSALLNPYDLTFDIPGVPDDGFLYFETDTLNRYARELETGGFQLHFHVTGDLGARLALDAIEAAANANGFSDSRHRLTHLYLIDPADRPRFKALNVIADFQYAPSATDPAYADFMTPYIGNRAEDLLPLFEMVDTSATVVLSSDWDADVLSPFEKIQSVLMLDTDHTLTLDTVIRMMTLDVAYLLHHDDRTGSIEPGKYADLIVIDRNLFETPIQQIDQTQVLLTLLAGEVVYRHPAAP